MPGPEVKDVDKMSGLPPGWRSALLKLETLDFSDTENQDQQLSVIKEKIDEIVDFINALGVSIAGDNEYLKKYSKWEVKKNGS